MGSKIAKTISPIELQKSPAVRQKGSMLNMTLGDTKYENLRNIKNICNPVKKLKTTL